MLTKIAFVSSILVAGMVYQQTDRTVNVKPNIEPGEAVEFMLEGSQESDKISWLVLFPADVELRRFAGGRSLIIDPPNNYTGVIKVVCRVVDFENRQTFDIEASTIAGGEDAVEGTSSDTTPESTLLSISKASAPEYSGEVFGAWNKAAKALAKGDDYNVVVAQLQADLKNVPGIDPRWSQHFDAVYKWMEGKPMSDIPAMYAEVAEGIKQRKVGDE